jgi:hypothetical protein
MYVVPARFESTAENARYFLRARPFRLRLHEHNAESHSSNFRLRAHWQLQRN